MEGGEAHDRARRQRPPRQEPQHLPLGGAGGSVPFQEGEHVRGVLVGLLERRPVAAVVEEHQARVGDVVEDGDAHLERDHPIIPPVNEEHGRLDAGERRRVVVRHAHGLPARLVERRRPGMRPVDIVHQLVADERFVVDVHAQIPADVLAGRIGDRLARGAAALRGPIGHQVPVAARADVRSAHHELGDPVRVRDGHDHGRLPALRVADELRPLDTQRVHEGDGGPGLDGVHALAIDDRSRLAEVGQVHEDASEVLREHADDLVEGDPGRGAGAVRVQEEHRLPGADVVVVDGHAPGLDGLARPCLGEPVRRDERHACLLVGRLDSPGTVA